MVLKIETIYIFYTESTSVSAHFAYFSFLIDAKILGWEYEFVELKLV